ncbi:MAG: phosphoribosylanthranilate isomerase [Leptospirales bacterium]
MRYRSIKICGITNLEDALWAVAQGADFLGMVMHKQSKRCCSVENAENINSILGSRPRVLVFGKDPAEVVIDLYNSLKDPLLFVQYPNDSEDFLQVEKEIGFERLIPSFGVSSDFKPIELEKLKQYAWIVLDTGGVKSATGQILDGGTGLTFDWNLVKNIKRPYFLAGGLNPDNVKEAAKIIDPFGFDVASGIESSPGKKDPKLVSQFIENSRVFDNGEN